MPLYKLTVAYDGTRFNGFQRQRTTSSLLTRPTKRPHWESNGKRKGCPLTIQECLETALIDLGNNIHELNLRFAGRTDKGVHAQGQVVVVQLMSIIDCTMLRKSLNSRLPMDISIEQVVTNISPNFCPRKDVILKQYSYTIKYRRKVYDKNNIVLPICESGPQTIRSALDPSCLWTCPWALQDDKLTSLCSFLQGQHDYRVFVHKDDRSTRDHVITIDCIRCEIISQTNEPAPVVTCRFTFQAKSFRRSMVRNLVGFCVDTCRGHDNVADLDWNDLWTGSERVAAKIHAAPASGLCLDHVCY